MLRFGELAANFKVAGLFENEEKRNQARLNNTRAKVREYIPFRRFYAFFSMMASIAFIKSSHLSIACSISL
jgi:hypothetical protein